jgi:phosphatidylglycerol:prolipoprotein diacylglycerol transferase
MIPILHRSGPFLIYGYTVALALGVLAAAGVTAWLTRRQALDDWFDAYLACLVAGVVGGRLGYGLANWAYFQDRPFTIIRIWQGGSSYTGALLAGIAGLWLWSVWQKRPFTLYADLLSPALALLSAFGWLACWLEGCAYGQETTLSLLAADLPDELGVFATRYQTQLIGGVWALVVFVITLAARKRLRRGQLFLLTVGLLSLGQTAVGLLRGDPGAGQASVIFNGTLVLICGILLAVTAVQKKQPPSEDET